MKKIYRLFIILLLLNAMLTSCDKFVEVPSSKSQIESGVVFADSSLAVSALLGAYYTLGTASVPLKNLGLYADEYAQTSGDPTLDEFSQSQLLPNNYLNQSLWNGLYSVLYQSNSVIEGLARSGLSQAKKQQLTAEARFLRAFVNLYLLNLYDHIPLILTSDVNLNRRAKQAEPQEVYDQIIKDLMIAKTDLGSSYMGIGKVRANGLAASALLARVYLYQSRWNDAEKEATNVINSGIFTPLSAPGEVFLASSKETILQLWNQNGVNPDAISLVPASATSLPTYLITGQLYHEFEATDNRKVNWIGVNQVTADNLATAYCYPAKYKNRTANTGNPEYFTLLRISEQFLIRAEALARQENTEGAVLDLNIIRARAGLVPLANTLSKRECLDAVAIERRLELFGECGHRFFDLKRTNQLDVVLGSLKPTWKPETGKALPIPGTEITYNPSLIQNYGY